MDEAAEPLADVANPAGLAVLAVADDIDADLRLLAHDAGDFIPQGLFVCGLVVGLPMVARRQDVADRHRAHEAADVGDKNTVGAALHGVLFVGGYGPTRRVQADVTAWPLHNQICREVTNDPRHVLASERSARSRPAHILPNRRAPETPTLGMCFAAGALSSQQMNNATVT